MSDKRPAGQCPVNCPKRKPGCHNVETCITWRIHEALKAARIKKNEESREIRNATKESIERVRHYYKGYYGNAR